MGSGRVQFPKKYQSTSEQEKVLKILRQGVNLAWKRLKEDPDDVARRMMFDTCVKHYRGMLRQMANGQAASKQDLLSQLKTG